MITINVDYGPKYGAKSTTNHYRIEPRSNVHKAGHYEVMTYRNREALDIPHYSKGR